MDRWEDADDDIDPCPRGQGRVARMGIAGFIKAAVAGSEQSDAPAKAVIVNSKREQRAAAARVTMPPPPAVAVALKGNVAAAAAGVARPAVPADAVSAPAGAMLLVHRDKQLLQQIPIVQPLTVFGRLPVNDVVLEHASISRQHAAVWFGQQADGSAVEAVLWDLGSAHGTFLQGKQLTKGQMCAWHVGDVARFGASTRGYTLHLPASGADSAAQDSVAIAIRAASEGSGASNGSKPQCKRTRVKFADNTAHIDATGAAGFAGADSKRSHLEQVVGYSDGRHFAAKVGPTPVKDGAGRFAHLLDSKVVMKPSTPWRQQQQQQQQQEVPQPADGEQQAQRSVASLRQQEDTAASAAANTKSRVGCSDKQQPLLQQSQQLGRGLPRISIAAAQAPSTAEERQPSKHPAQKGQQQQTNQPEPTAELTNKQLPAALTGSSSTTAVSSMQDLQVRDAMAAAAAATVAAGSRAMRTPGFNVATEVTRTWSGGARDLLLPPQVQRKASGTLGHHQRQQQEKQLTIERNPATSRLYGDLPAARATDKFNDAGL